MPAVWFAILASMLTTYAVLDGFDFGAGIAHFLVAKSEAERRTVLAAIGPLWDGNEVWLVASGGIFVFAFPSAYAAAFSGLYLPLTLVIWLILLRGVAIEMRSQLEHPLWRRGFDVMFAGSSAIMAIVLGVALGNVIRGVPLGPSGYFHEDLFGGTYGALDPYTCAMGLFAFVTLAGHGATFLAWKTEGALSGRSAVLAGRCYRALLVLVIGVSVLTFFWVPAFFHPVVRRPWLWPLPLLAFVAAVRVTRALPKGRFLEAFLASCSFIALLLVASAAALYPTILRSTVGDAFSIDTSSSTGARSLSVGLGLCGPALALAVAYTVHVFRSFRGKASPDGGHA
jgi:cytochrome d ubiquinol oxidase subunit II